MYIQCPWVYVCCDNSGVIKHLNQVNHGPLNPNQTVMDNYEIFKAIMDTQHKLTNIQVIKFLHVLSHQDQKHKKWTLSLEECLNIDCDAAMARLNSTIQNQEVLTQHPQIQQAIPHLVIKWSTIVQQIQHHLHSTATVPAYNKYFKNKYH